MHKRYNMSDHTMESIIKRIEELEKKLLKVELVKTEDTKKTVKKDVEKEGKKKDKEEDVKEKKKRGMTGYLLYAKEMRPVVKEELVSGGNENPKPTEVITEVAKRWKTLSEDKREEWNTRAKSETDEE